MSRPSAPMRSLSSDNLSSQLNRQSAGRSSSIGRPSSIMGRPSSIMGRPSMAPSKPKEYCVQEMLTTINSVLDSLHFSNTHQTLNLKTLTPSCANSTTFYAIFEFLLSAIGIKNIWDLSFLTNNNPNQPISSSQPSQVNNPAAINKQRHDLVVYHLSTLRYNNIPKPSVFQTMTSQKNWYQMLQILYFLANNLRLMQIYDPFKLLFSIDKNREPLNDYLKKAYVYVLKDQNFTTTEEYKIMKSEAILRFETQLRSNVDKKHLESERDNAKKQYDIYYATRNELESLTQEEQDLMNQLAEEEAQLNALKTNIDETCQRIKIDKKDLHTIKDKLRETESEAAVKDALYDEQLAKGTQMNNLQVKHNQKEKELVKLQNICVDLENAKDTLQGKCILKTQEAKEVIAKANEIVNKIQLNSTLAISEFPQLDVIDLHKKADMIKEYKDQLLAIRHSYNSSICRLPAETSQIEEEKKIAYSKIEMYKSKHATLEKDTRACENILNDLLKKKDQAIEEANDDLNHHKRIFKESENMLKGKREELASTLNMKNLQKQENKAMMMEGAQLFDVDSKQVEEIKLEAFSEVSQLKNETVKDIIAISNGFKEVAGKLQKEYDFWKKLAESRKMKS